MMMATGPVERLDETLGGVAKYVNGRAFTAADFGPSGLPVIRIEQLTNSSVGFDRCAGDVDSRHRVDDGDILVSWSATLDVFLWNRGPAALNQHIFKVIPNREKVHPRFLYYLLRSVIGVLRSKVHGATMRHITKPKFLSLPVRIPAEISEQESIASRLDSELEAHRALLQGCLEQEKISRGLSGSMIGSALLEAASSLGTLGKVLLGKPSTGWSPVCDDDPQGTPVLTLSAVTGFEFRPFEIKRTGVASDPFASYWVKEGDILVTRSNTLDLVGHAAFVEAVPEPTIFPDLMFRLRVNRDLADPQFVHLWLMSGTFREYVRQNARGSSGTMKKITQTMLTDAPFPSGIDVSVQSAIAEGLAPRLELAQAISAAADEGLSAAHDLLDSLVIQAVSE